VIFRTLDANGDWVFGKGIQDFARGQQAIALNLQTLIQCWVGDCFFSLQTGINWKRLMNYGQQANLNSALQSLVLRAYGVVSIVSSKIDFSAGSRKFTASYTVNTVYSQQVTNQLTILSTTGN
jgi:hypothetical protein